MRTSRKHVLLALAASGVVAATGRVASGIDVAENLLINLDSSVLTPGSTVSSWANAGSLGGEFRNDTFYAPNSSVQAGTVRGTTAAIFNGNDAMVSMRGPDPLYAPAGLVGADPTRSIEAWVYNPGISTEETM